MSDTTVEAKPKFDATAAVKKYAILLILIGFMVILTLVTGGTFLRAQNLINVVVQVAPIGIVALGMMFAIITKGIDLSVGSTVALVAVVSASLAQVQSDTMLLPGLPPLPIFVSILVGLLVGAIPFAIPGLGDLTLGNAAGPLIIGLILGRLGRSGRVVWTMPHQAAETLTQLGLLLFLAYAGGRAGHALIEAIKTPLGIKLILAGLLVTGVHALALLLIGRRILGSSGPRVAGVIAGSQTQPAVLAFANDSTGYDARVALGYALVYPVAMVTKIIVAQILTML